MSALQEHSLPVANRERTPGDFARPPVGETSVGFYFQKIVGWNLVHQGAVWDKFRAQYPSAEVRPPVPDAASVPAPPKIIIDPANFLIRTFFVDETKSHLVQIQDGLLLHNWRKVRNTDQYQRYETSRSRLRDDWCNFQSYLSERSFKIPAVVRCEMSYFNHLVRNEDWEDFADLPNIFTVWSGVSQSPVGGRLQEVSFGFSYRLEKGTVNIAVQPGVRSTDGKEILQFTLSSSMAPNGFDEEQLFRCLDECHENAARVFNEFTTDQARERWQ